MVDVRGLSDKALLDCCERFGREALLWRNKFRALLPEVEKRKLWKKKGYRDIYEFGMRLAGLSMAQVAESLNVAERLEDKPELRGLLESGEVSVNKIVRVMSIATVENESELAEKVQLLSSRALEVFVRDIKFAEQKIDDQSALTRLHVQESACGITASQDNTLKLAPDVEQELLKLQEKGIDINQLLRETLNRREQELTQTKDQIAEELPESSSRYIPTRVRNVIKQEHGTKCAIKGCNKPSREVHHAARFSLSKSHDPKLIAPLCKEHHQIAHSMDVRYQEVRRLR